MPETEYVIGAGQIFTIFFIMLGPLRFRDNYSSATSGMNLSEKSKLSFKAAAIAYLALMVAGFIGAKILSKWDIPAGALLLASGLLFFLVTLPPLLNFPARSKKLTTSPIHPADVALRMIITPYGMAALVVLISLSRDTSRLLTISVCLLIIMILNGLSMTFSKSDDRKTSFPMQVLSTVLNTLQLALSIHIMIVAFKNWTL